MKPAETTADLTAEWHRGRKGVRGEKVQVRGHFDRGEIMTAGEKGSAVGKCRSEGISEVSRNAAHYVGTFRPGPEAPTAHVRGRR